MMKKVMKTLLALAMAFVCGGAWAGVTSVTPKFLVNFKFKDGADVSGWNNWTQASGNYLGDSSGITDTDSGIKFVTTGNGNFDNSYSACSQDYSTGHYVDIFGSDHASLMEEVKTSLGLGSDISSDVYNTGLMNRGMTGHTVTISGLDHSKSYVVYSGYGVYRANGYNQGFSIETSGYTSVSKLEYVTTVAGTGTSVATQYTEFQPSTTVRPGNNGLMLVRATGIVPTAAGEIKFKLDGSHAGMNFLAIAELELADVARVDGVGYKTLEAAFEAAGDGQTVTLLEDMSKGLTIPVGKIVDAGTHSIGGAIVIGENAQLTISGTQTTKGISGSGKLVKNGTGEVKIGKDSSNNSISGVTVEVNGGALWLGYSGVTEGAKLQDCTFVLNGGTLKGYGWPNISNVTFDCRQNTTIFSGTNSGHSISGGSIIKTGSGSLTIDAHLRGSLQVAIDGGSFTIPNTRSIESGVRFTRVNLGSSDSLTASYAVTFSGSISGSGTINANLTVTDTATINPDSGALTLGSGRTLTLGNSINLTGSTLEEGTAILTGLSSAPAALSFVGVTVNNAEVANAHLYYEGGSIKYSAQGDAAWTPNTSALENGILVWTKQDAWLNGSTPATWPTEQSTAEDLSVEIDAADVKGVKIEGQVYVKNVTVLGTRGEGESFQFHNRMMTVNNDQEVNPDGADHDCLHTSGVDLTKLNGELGLKVPITGEIAFGSGTHLVFVTGTGETPSTAYGYSFVDRGGSITIEGSGKFTVPTAMHGLAFSVNETATVIYEGATDTIGTLSGNGTVELQGGKTISLNPAYGQALHYVSAGTTANTLRWNGTGSSLLSINDTKQTPFVTVKSGATLNLYGHDYAGWDGAVADHSWFVNNGTLVFQNDGGSRFWRDHIVLGNGSKVKIDTGDRHILLYGGVGSAEKCQIMLESGTATIEAGVTNQGKTRQSLYFGNDGGGTYGTKGAGIAVGSGAMLTVSVPIDGGDPMAKYGAGTLILSDVSSYSGTITLKGGAITVPAKLEEGRIITEEKILKFDEATKTYSLVDPVAKIVGTPTRYFETLREAIDAAGNNLESIIVLDQDAEVPAGYVVSDGHIAKLVVDGDVISLSNKSAGSTNRSNFDSNNTFKLTIPVSAGRPSGTKVMVRYVDVGYDYESNDTSLVHYMEINGVRSKEVAYTANHYATSEHRLRYEFEGLVLDCGTEYAITMLNASKSAHTGPRFLLRQLSDAATANATAVIHDNKYSDNGDIYCIYSEVTANAVVNKLAANYVGDAYTSYGTAAKVVTAAKAGVVGLVSNVTLEPTAGDVLTIVKNGNTVTISGTPQALETTYVGVTTYDVFKRIIYQTSSTVYLCKSPCGHNPAHNCIDDAAKFYLNAEGTGDPVVWQEGDVIVMTYANYWIGPGLAGKTFIMPSDKTFDLNQTGDTGASFVNAKVYVVGTVNQSASTIKNSSFILRGGTLKVTESYKGTLAITGYGTATKNDAALALPFYGVKPESDEEEVMIEEVVETVEIVPNTNVKVPVDTDVSKIKVKYGNTDLTGGDSPKVTVTVNPSSGKVELATTDAAKPAETAITMSTPTVETQDKVQFTITSPIPGLFYAVSSCDTPDGTFESATGDQATSDAAKTVSIPMTFTDGKKVKYYKVSVKATK